MRRLFILFLPVVALAATSAAPTSARAASGVTDDAGFFSATAIRQAEEIIRQNTGHPHRDIRVITVSSIPDDLKNEFESQGINPFFEHWANNLFKRDKVDGVLILICKNPSHLQVEVGDNTREKVFPDADRRDVATKLIAAFSAKKFDEGLLDAVRFIHVRESANAGAAKRAMPAPPAHVPNVPARELRSALQPVTLPTTPPATQPATAPTTQSRAGNPPGPRQSVTNATFAAAAGIESNN